LPAFRGTHAASCLAGCCRGLAIVAAISGSSLLPIDIGYAAWPKQIARVSAKPGAPPTRRTSQPVALKCDRSKFPILLDVGHTAEAPGALSARNIPEFDFNMRLAKRIAESLKSEGFVETSLLVTEGKAKPSLWKRVAAANRSGARLLLSIHHDSVPDSLLEEWEFEGTRSHFSDRFTGYSLFVSRRNPRFETSLKFGKLLGRQLKAEGLEYARQYTQPLMGRYRRKLLDKDAGVYRFDDLVVLRWSRMPAVLLEAGSIINRDEELAMNSPERQDMISAAVAGAVKQFCDLR
jgi:N-acetylmuramoyl-L-alanine amidase